MSETREKTEADAAQEAVAPYCRQINSTPALMSLLYDIDLMPEQIHLAVNARRMAAFCEVFKRLTPHSIATLFERQSTP